jgi:prepilin-type N-terminal cleavage/methylation domain-containing protein
MMKKNKNKGKIFAKGFTLIELLMVVAIIGLLATVVLASLNVARMKAHNQAGNETVRSYVNAIELFKSENPGAPYPLDEGPSGDRGNICLGCPDGSCAQNSPDKLNVDLSPYITPPGGVCRYYGPNLAGIRYNCTDTECNGYKLEWELGGEGEKCLGGGGIYNPIFDATHCIYSNN